MWKVEATLATAAFALIAGCVSPNDIAFEKTIVQGDDGDSAPSIRDGSTPVDEEESAANATGMADASLSGDEVDAADADTVDAPSDAVIGSDVSVTAPDASAEAGIDAGPRDAAEEPAIGDGSSSDREVAPIDAPAESGPDAPYDAGLICDPTVGCCPAGDSPGCFYIQGVEWVEACCAPSDMCQPIPDAGIHPGACN